MLRGSAADPLNLIQVMLAKGCSFKSFRRFPDRSKRKAIMKPTRASIEPQSSEPLPKSSKVYVKGKLHAEVCVPFREIQLTPTKSNTGKSEVNAPVRVYDCSGPWGDESFARNVEEGLPALRSSWISGRGDVEEVAPSYRPIPGRSDAEIPTTLKRKPLRAKAGKIVTQLHYARKGLVTPEMEFIAIRENLGREKTKAGLQNGHSGN